MNTGEGPRNIQSWPHSKGSGRNVLLKLRLGGGAKEHNTNENTLPGSGRLGAGSFNLAPLCR
jgi:hypothetical protein